jgi:hypothetical protein
MTSRTSRRQEEARYVCACAWGVPTLERLRERILRDAASPDPVRLIFGHVGGGGQME